MSRQDVDIAEARPPAIARAAGVALGFAGLTAILLAGQIHLSIRVPAPWSTVLWAMLAAGVMAMVVGAALLRARGWAAATGLATALSLAGLGAAWAMWSFSRGVLHAMPLLQTAAAVIALGLAAGAGPAVVRTAAARKRLRDAGLDLG